MQVVAVAADMADLLAAMVAPAAAEVVDLVLPQWAQADQTVVVMEHPLQEEPVVQMPEVAVAVVVRGPCPVVLGVPE